MPRLHAIPVAALLSLAATAQDFIGFTYNVDISATSRGAIGNNAGEVMTRLDSSEHAGWGADTPGSRTVAALAVIVQDINAATQEFFDLKLYPEDPANPGFPNLNAGVTFATGVPGPTGIGGQATLRVVAPSVPVAVPITGGGDIFVSFVLPIASATDGLSTQVVLGYNPGAFTRWDTPSTLQGGSPPPAAAAGNSHFLSRIGASMAYSQRRQHWIDVAHSASGGCGLAITNQTSWPQSANPAPTGWGPAPGTADFLSGSFPDAMGTNPGRADDVTMWYTRTGIGVGNPVVFLLDQDYSPNWGVEIAVNNLFGGATGWTCLVNPSIYGFSVTNATEEAWLTTVLTPSVRLTLSGLTGKQQAVGVDANGVFHASPCDAVRF